MTARRLRRDDGAVIVLVAVSMVVIVAIAALVIDLGNGWRTRRALIPATDAAALAAAQAFIDDNGGCAVALDYLDYNESAASLVSCDKVDIDTDRGRVTVTASHDVETWFASAIGLGDYTVTSTSIAAWAPAGGVYGLRPIGFCLEGSSELQDLVENPPDVETDITIRYEKDQPDACGDDSFVPGNWGAIDYVGRGNNFKDWVENGYDGLVNFEYHTVTDCSDDHCYDGDPGNLPGAKNELDDLRDSEEYFTLPVFNFVNDLPGKNAEFHIAAIIRVRLMSYNLTGSDDASFTLRVKPGLVDGPCCAGGSGDGSAGNKVIAICGVDPGEFEACEP